MAYVLFFGAVLFTGRLLAPGDGWQSYLPHYRMPFTLWNPDLLTGFPEAADPQTMRWYLPRVVLSALPGSWNAFVVAAYIFASWFTYLYLRVLRESEFASLIGGMVYGLSGFMVAHLGHTPIIHGAAWIPCLLYCAEQLWRTMKVRWVLLGGLATSQCVLAGHPQVPLYGIVLTGAYVLVRGWRRPGWLRYWGAHAVVLFLGLLLSAVQTIPTALLSSQTSRASMTFETFSSYSLTVPQLATLAFPYVFGGFDEWDVSEALGYVGVSILVLAAIAVLSRWRVRSVKFWAAAAVVGLLGALGPATPMGKLIYNLPALGMFRCQGRLLSVFCLAIAVLGAHAIQAIEKKPKRSRDIALVAGALVVLVAAALVIDRVFWPQFATGRISGGPHVQNFCLRVPVILGLISSAILLRFLWAPKSLLSRSLLFATLAGELISFGWAAEWRWSAPAEAQLQPPPFVRQAAAELRASGGRWVAVRGYQGVSQEAPPDMSGLWKVPAIGRYGQLVPSRFEELIQMESNGYITGPWWDARDRAYDIVGGRLFAGLDDAGLGFATFQGVPFLNTNLDVMVGKGCGAPVRNQTISFSHPRNAARVAVVSQMGCSAEFTQGTPVMTLDFHTAAGATETVNLRAGIDTAEWAIECPDVAPAMRHQAAPVYSRYPVGRPGANCQGLKFVTFLDLPGGPADVQSIDLRWLPQSGQIQVLKLALIDAQQHAQSVRELDVHVGDPSRWTERYDAGVVAVHENRHAMPRSWMVPKTLMLQPDAVKQAIQTSRFSDGSEYDPYQVALIEEPVDLQAEADPSARVRLVADRETSLDLETTNRNPSFLILGDLFYAGWTASINGHSTPILRTNYIQRGIMLPPGQNAVHFAYRPTDFYAGLALTVTGLLLMAGSAFLAHRRNAL